MIDRCRTRGWSPSRGPSVCTGRARGGLVALVVTGALLGGVGSAAASSDQWNSAGGNLQNTRWQAGETTLSASNVAALEKKWEFTTGGDVSATPAVDGDTVYFPDRAGNLYAVDKVTGQQRWRSSIGGASGVPGNRACSERTPCVSARFTSASLQAPRPVSRSGVMLDPLTV